MESRAGSDAVILVNKRRYSTDHTDHADEYSGQGKKKKNTKIQRAEGFHKGIFFSLLSSLSFVFSYVLGG
jgi:hypothetical protein